MCIFSRAVKQVSGTQIFARRIDDRRQALVYAMTIAADEPLAMVLPLPVVPGGGDDAVAFVDLSGYPDFFADCARAFPEPTAMIGRGMMFAAQAAVPKTLAVHAVGDFVASYVPSPADFARLDPRFRLPDGALAAHAEYADYGFAVFQLAPHAIATAATPAKRRWWQRKPPPPPPADDGAATIHPMAFTFPSRLAPGALYFPTLHLHDGAAVPREADYDHALYCQTDDEILARTFAWRASDGALDRRVDVDRAEGMIARRAPAYRRTIYGLQRNCDHVIEAPACRVESLSARDPWFRFDLAATAAYYTELDSAKNRAWRTTARTRLDELHAGLVTGLSALVAANRGAWHLAKIPDNPNVAWLSNHVPHFMTPSGPVPIAGDSPCVFALGASSDRVERQNVTFAFTRVPSPEMLRTIEAAIAELLDRAIS